MYKVEELFDLTHTRAAEYLKKFMWPHEALSGIKPMIEALGAELPKDEFEHPAPWARYSRDDGRSVRQAALPAVLPADNPLKARYLPLYCCCRVQAEKLLRKLQKRSMTSNMYPVLPNTGHSTPWLASCFLQFNGI